MIRILFQGDSITDGGRLKPAECRWDLNHQIGHCYVFPIVAELGRKYPGKYTFINRGMSGDTVETMTGRWQTDTLDEHPDILSMLLGVNGQRAFEGKTSEEAEALLQDFDRGYRALLDGALGQNPNMKLILMEPFSTRGEEFRAILSRKQAIIRKIAEDYGAIFIPTQERLEALIEETAPILAANGWEGDPGAYWLWDGVHPTEVFHGYLAELWLEAAAPIL